MAITAKKVIDRVRAVVNDAIEVRWLDPELLNWINDGRREIDTYQPGMFSQTANIVHKLADGCYQKLVANNAYAIAAVTHNVNANGSVGDAIRVTQRDVMDTFKPGWLADSGTKVQNWVQDTISPVSFFVYPAVKGGSVLVVARVAPPELTSVNDTALPFDQFLVPLVNYVLHRAYAKDAEVAKNAQLSADYLNLFTAAVSAKG